MDWINMDFGAPMITRVGKFSFGIISPVHPRSGSGA